MCHLYWPFLLHVLSSRLLCVNCEQLLFSSSESSVVMCYLAVYVAIMALQGVLCLLDFCQDVQWEQNGYVL
jgi:hypothetical protein